MKTTRNIAVIFNFNLPEKTDCIYEKLITDGFNKSDIIVVDNGSDKSPLAKNTNLALPKNVRFTGQAYMALTYLLDFYEFDNVLLITTSAGLKNEVNYLNEVHSICDDFDNDFGFVSASLTGGDTDSNAPEQSLENISERYIKLYKYQPIMILVSKKLLKYCRENEAAYFNLLLKRGWGIDRELQYVADSNDLTCRISRDLSVIWDTNLTHKKGLADESRDKYHQQANIEMEAVFSNRYGYNWETKFMESFGKEVIRKSRIKLFLKYLLNNMRVMNKRLFG